MALQLFAMHRQNIRALALIICTFTYLMIGAAIFDALESETDNEKRELVERLRGKMMAKYNFSKNDYRIIETVVVKSIPHKAGLQWKFAGAFYFATVVITTVGYGHSTPATASGKAFCIFYALAGIPLNLVMFQSIGERLNALICYVLNSIKKLLRLKVDVSVTHMIMVSCSLGSLVVIFGTYLFCEYENWNWYDSFYYCFVTLTTIGFGDYVALQKDDTLSSNTWYVIFTLLFILFGMAIFAAAVNLLVLRFMATSSEPDSLEREQAKKLVLQDLAQGHSDDDLAAANGLNLMTRSGYQMRASSFLELAKLEDDQLDTSEIDEDKTRYIRAASAAAATTRVTNQPIKSLPASYPVSGAAIGLVHTEIERKKSDISLCSCSCYKVQPVLKKRRPLVPFLHGERSYYTVTRAPGRVVHLAQQEPIRRASYIHQHHVITRVQNDPVVANENEGDALLMRNLRNYERSHSQ